MSPTQMKLRLESAFPGDPVEVRDLTGTEDHYEVQVTSSVFAGLTRMEQHQKVMAAFQAELKTGEVHALTIRTQTHYQASK
jgi:stress-induced morphogen